MGKVYDCIMFYNEFDMLTLRLHELDKVVDHFVILESRKTFSNLNKKLYFQENKDKFAQFSSKIIHLVLDEFPESVNNPWAREFYQRDYSTNYIKNNSNPDDIVIFCDADEIPQPLSIEHYKIYGSEPQNFEMDFYYYNFNWLKKEKLYVSTICLCKHLHQSSPQQLRNRRNSLPRLPYCGWHLSYFLNLDDIKNKIRSFAHQEFNNDTYLDDTKF